MKGLVAAVATVMTVLVAITVAIVELLIKLAPLLIVAGCLWAVLKLVRAQRARMAADDQRLVQAWAHQPVAYQPVAAPTAQVVPEALLPPVIAHRERMYVVRGEDTGLVSDRDDGYVHVSANVLPRVHRLPATYHHRRKFTPRRSSGRRSGRRRP
ncbi:hypothetical protein O982_24940 [Mycobacterium avium 10-5581]|nr:hypothetical protein O982_24940 [Mycobacterium avium 10-5581]